MRLVPPIAPDLSLGTAYPAVAQLWAALEAEDWPAVENLFAGVDRAGGSLLVWAAGTPPGAYGFLSSRAESEPPDALAETLFASQLIRAGWEAGTAAGSGRIPRQDLLSQDYLRRAERLLAQVTDRDPRDAVAWELRLVTARGLGLGLDEARQRYGRAVASAPHHLPAQLQLLQQLCPKWGGSLDEVHEFARQCAAAAPDGSPNAVVVAAGHIEHWLAVNGRGYLSIRQVWEEISEAAERSVWHPDYRPDYGWVGVQNIFAMAFSLADDRAAAARCFSAVGHLADRFPWSYLGMPGAAFLEHRRRARADGPPPQLRDASAPPEPAPAVPSGGGRSPLAVTLWVLGGLVALCGLAGVFGGLAEPDGFGGSEWTLVGVVMLVGTGLILWGTMVGRRRRRREERGGA